MNFAVKFYFSKFFKFLSLLCVTKFYWFGYLFFLITCFYLYYAKMIFKANIFSAMSSFFIL